MERQVNQNKHKTKVYISSVSSLQDRTPACACAEIVGLNVTHVCGRQYPIRGDQHPGTSTEGRPFHPDGEPGILIWQDVDAVDDEGSRSPQIVTYVRISSISGILLLVVGCRGLSGDVGGAVSSEEIAKLVVIGRLRRAVVSCIILRRRLEQVRNGQVSLTTVVSSLYRSMTVSDRLGDRPADGIVGGLLFSQICRRERKGGKGENVRASASTPSSAPHDGTLGTKRCLPGIICEWKVHGNGIWNSQVEQVSVLKLFPRDFSDLERDKSNVVNLQQIWHT